MQKWKMTLTIYVLSHAECEHNLNSGFTYYMKESAKLLKIVHYVSHDLIRGSPFS